MPPPYLYYPLCIFEKKNFYLQYFFHKLKYCKSLNQEKNKKQKKPFFNDGRRRTSICVITLNQVRLSALSTFEHSSPSCSKDVVTDVPATVVAQ